MRAVLSAIVLTSVTAGVGLTQATSVDELQRAVAPADSSWRALEPRPASYTPPAPPLPPAPTEVRALYVNVWQWGGQRFWDFVRLAEETEINALVLDVKDATGIVSYASNVPTAVEIGASSRRVRNPRERIQALLDRGIYPIARIVVAKDPLLAEKKPTWAVQDRRGGLWRDRIDHAWVDAYNDSVWVYAGQLGLEAARLGFSEVQFDYVRFPDEPESRLQYAKFPSRQADDSRREAVTRNIATMRRIVEQSGVPVTLAVFGLTTSATGDLGIGQVWEDLIGNADILSPMIYPSHYGRGSYGIAQPNSEPYEIVYRAVRDALQRSPDAQGQIRPYLQAFNIRPPIYGGDEIRAQIQALSDHGIRSWILWNPRGVYRRDALLPPIDSLPTGQGSSR